MNRLAVDTGAVNIGWAILDYRPRVLAYGLFTPVIEKNDLLSVKVNSGMVQAYSFFRQLIEQYDVKELLVEQVPMVPGMAQRDRVVATSSTLKCLAIQKNIKWAEVHSTSAKKNLTGNGHATKLETQAKIKEIFSELTFEKKTAPDIFDAIQIGLYNPSNWWNNEI